MSNHNKCKLDLVIIMDTSSSITRGISSEMEDMTNFVYQLIDTWFRPHINSGDIAIGVVGFGGRVNYSISGGNFEDSLSNEVLLLQTGDTDAILTEFNSVNFDLFPWGGGTSISAGLCAAHRQFQEWYTNNPSRVGTTKKMLLLTDGVGLHTPNEFVGGLFYWNQPRTHPDCVGAGLFSQLPSATPNPSGDASTLAEFTVVANDITNSGYTSIVVAIDDALAPSEYVRITELHTDSSNNFNAYGRVTFSELLEPEFITDIILSSCPQIECDINLKVEDTLNINIQNCCNITIQDNTDYSSITLKGCDDPCEETPSSIDVGDITSYDIQLYVDGEVVHEELGLLNFQEGQIFSWTCYEIADFIGNNEPFYFKGGELVKFVITLNYGGTLVCSSTGYPVTTINVCGEINPPCPGGPPCGECPEAYPLDELTGLCTYGTLTEPVQECKQAKCYCSSSKSSSV